MTAKTNSSGGGLGFAGALFLVFLVLKLTGVVDWSWWWVTAPLWGIPVVLIAAVMVFGFLATRNR